jgi:hypothetical protein
MLFLERSTKRLLRTPSPRDRALIAVIATAYILMHAVAGVMLIQATMTVATTAQDGGRE